MRTILNQKGFTLLELIIVVAIMGILVAIALPQYQNYQVRSRIGDALSLVGSAKTAVGIYYSEKKEWPFNNAEAGLPDAESISSGHVREIKIQSTTPLCGIIRIRLRDISELGAMKNDSIYLTPTAPTASEGKDPKGIPVDTQRPPKGSPGDPKGHPEALKRHPGGPQGTPKVITWILNPYFGSKV